MLAVGCGNSSNGAGGGSGSGGGSGGGSSSGGGVAVLTAIQVTPIGQAISVGTTQQMVATGIYNNGSSAALSNVTWATSVNTTASISSAGLVTGIGLGRVTITATCGSISGSTPLTVTAASLVNVTINPASSNPLPAGATQQFQLLGGFADGTTQDVTSGAIWTSSSNSTATVSTLGLATGVTAGVVNITANFQGLTATVSLTISTATLKSVAITPSNPSIASGTTVQLSATGTYSDNSTLPLTTSVAWSSSSSAIANVSSTGLVSSTGSGTVTINATVSTPANVSGTTTVTVKPITLVTLSVAPPTQLVALGTTAQLRAIGFFNDNSAQDLTSQSTWYSSNTGTAIINATTPGLINPLAVGTAKMSANCTVNGTTVGSINQCAVTVTNATLTGLAITPLNSKVQIGTPAVQFNINGTFSDGTQGNLTSSCNFTATPNITVAGSTGPPITSGGLFNTTVAGNYNVTGTYYNVNATALGNATTQIQVIQPPPSGPILFTGFYTGNIAEFTIDPTTGVLTNLTTPITPSANPVWSIVCNAFQPVIYLTQYIPPPLNYQTFLSGLTVAQSGNSTVNTTFTSAVSPNSLYTADFAIINRWTTAVFPYEYIANTTTTAYRFYVAVSPLNGDGTIPLPIANPSWPTAVPPGTTMFDIGDGVDGSAGPPVIPPSNNGVTGISALAGSPTGPYFYTSDPNGNVYSFNADSPVTYTGTPIVPLIGHIDRLATDPLGRILVGINTQITPDPTHPNVQVFPINDDGTLTAGTTVSTVGLMGSNKASMVRTNGNIVVVLSNSGAAFAAYYYNYGLISPPISPGLQPLGEQFTGQAPVDIDIDPTEQFIYVANNHDGTVSAWAINNSTTSTPTLSPVSGSPFTVGGPITALKVFR